MKSSEHVTILLCQVDHGKEMVRGIFQEEVSQGSMLSCFDPVPSLSITTFVPGDPAISAMNHYRFVWFTLFSLLDCTMYPGMGESI